MLEEILAGVREDVAARQGRVPFEGIRELVMAAAPAIDAYAALRKRLGSDRRGEAFVAVERARSPTFQTWPTWPGSRTT